MQFFNQYSKHILWRTFTLTITLSCVVSVTFFIPGSSHIRCVQCSSDQTLSCLDDPPEPVSCLKKEKFCQTVRKMDTNGTIIGLQRDCAFISTEECIREDSIVVCTNTCDKPGCNHGSHLRQYFDQIIFMLSVWKLITYVL